MQIIGITGGIGSGKSTVLNIFKETYHAFVLEADKVAHLLMAPGGITYKPLLAAFGTDILDREGVIDRQALGTIVFASQEKLNTLNQITHPAVRTYILESISKYKVKHPDGLFVLEAALLIEEGYDDICDEIWYVFADRKTRIKRLMDRRGYSMEKCISIINSQSGDAFYRQRCKHMLDNSTSVENTKIQIDKLLKKL